MTNQGTSHQSRYKDYIAFETGAIKPFLEELWYLRVPAFSAVLSIFFLALIPQTQEVYRVFALNPIRQGWQITFSFGFVFLLALSIWYAGRSLSIKRKDELSDNNEEWTKILDTFVTKQPELSLTKFLKTLVNFFKSAWKALAITGKGILSAVFLKREEIESLRHQNDISNSVASTKVNALLWLPRFFGALPLIALALGLFLTLMTQVLLNLFLGIGITALLLAAFLIIVIGRRAFLPKSRTDSDSLFSQASRTTTFFSSILVFSIFALPLIPNGIVKLITCFVIVTILLVRLWISKLFSKTAILIYLFLLAIFSFFAISYHPATLPSFLGSVSIVALFLTVLVIFTSVTFYWGYSRKIAVLTSLVALAFVLSFFNWNDNHHLRELSEPAKPLPALEASFKTWIESRQDIAQFRDEKKPYPIYVVSAQGGGIFAAYHTALTLSRLQDLSPNFASHVFAISGVSGGSLGSSVFSSLVNSNRPDCSNSIFSENQASSFEARAHCLLDQDFLSPLLAAGLFPDFVQRFLPSIPVLSQAFDRARGLEYAFEQAWLNQDWKKKANPVQALSQKLTQGEPNPLQASYYEHWNAQAESPALVFNTTVVETGERLVISPFTLKENSKFPVSADISTLACSDQQEQSINFSLSTAAVLSARFPYVTPVGWFNKCKDKEGQSIAAQPKGIKTRLVDGGYFENSGFSTALAIGERLKESLKKYQDGTQFKVVYLALTDNSFIEPSAEGLNELLSPVRAFFNSREARGRGVVEQAEYEIDGGKSKTKLSEHEFRQFYLTHAAPNIPVKPCRLDFKTKRCSSESSNGNNQNFNLPLGWYLSAFSQEYIRDRIGVPSACSSDSLYPANNNHCVMKSILDELSSKAPNS